jgi:hypothetical protein
MNKTRRSILMRSGAHSLSLGAHTLRVRWLRYGDGQFAAWRNLHL